MFTQSDANEMLREDQRRRRQETTMSADNWTTCPQCRDRRSAKIAENERQLQVAYGKIPLDKYSALQAETAALRNAAPEATLREDYEIFGADEGVVTVSYSCSCGVCHIGHSFKYDSLLPIATATGAA